jgi:rod shape-determining protein MreC
MKLNGKKLILLAAAILVVCCGTMLLSALHPSRPTVLGSALGAIVTPLEQAAASAGEAISDFFGYFYRYDALEAENEALRKELAKFQKLENLFHEAINENEQLRKLTEIREKHTDFQCELASVVSTVDLGIHSSFTINKGSLVGIEAGDCVITDAGLVGYISEAGPNFSTVVTVLNIEFQASALNTRTRETLVAQGNFDFAPKGLLKLSWLDHGANIMKNDVIVTTGSTNYPTNLTIGTIRDFSVEDHGISSYATIEPAVDFSRLTDVFVVKEFEVVN